MTGIRTCMASPYITFAICILRSRRMYQSDLQSNLATAEDRGRKEGKKERNLEIARMMVAAGEPVEKIIRYTELTQQEIAGI